jgi:NADPH-dependent 2,4-dienoyl-CoA reductase/sulfur reductase-like enzyme
VTHHVSESSGVRLSNDAICSPYNIASDMSTTPTHKKVVVVGAGPIGCLAAMAFAKRAWRVDLYESRSGQ